MAKRNLWGCYWKATGGPSKTADLEDTDLWGIQVQAASGEWQRIKRLRAPGDQRFPKALVGRDNARRLMGVMRGLHTDLRFRIVHFVAETR